MNFIEAIKLAKQGKIMGYKVIEDDYINYLSTHGEYSSTNECLVKADTSTLEEVYISDILRDDWMEVEPLIELHSFEEAFRASRAFQKGALIKRIGSIQYHKENTFSAEDIEANDWVIKEEV